MKLELLQETRRDWLPKPIHNKKEFIMMKLLLQMQDLKQSESSRPLLLMLIQGIPDGCEKCFLEW